MQYIPSSDRYKGIMKYNRCGNSGLKLPAITLGFWQHFGASDPYDNCRAIVRRAFDLGITHFDLANNYGTPPGSTESIVGKILSTDLKGYRDEIVITTKAGYGMWDGPYGEWGSKKYLVASMDQSLKRIGVDYVDIFFSHRPDPETPLEETMATLDLFVRQGKALYIGLSNYDVKMTEAALKILDDLGTPCLVHQPSYSLFNRWIEDGLLDLLEKKGVGTIVFQPLQRGALTDTFLGGIPKESAESLREIGITEERVVKARLLNQIAVERGQTLAQMSLAWALRNGRVASLLAGAKFVSHVDENVAALNNLEFTQDELDRIDQILKN